MRLRLGECPAVRGNGRASVLLPSAEEVSAAYFDFTEKLVANQKAYTEKILSTVKSDA